MTKDEIINLLKGSLSIAVEKNYNYYGDGMNIVIKLNFGGVEISSDSFYIDNKD